MGVRSLTGRPVSGPQPVMLIAVAIWILWGFGYETIGQRLLLELDGVVISRQEIPRSWATHGTGTAYVVRGADGTDHRYVSGATDASLPDDIPIGADLEKHGWQLSYSLNGVRVDDFPRYFYSAMCGIALACLLWAALQWVRRHD